MDHGGSQTTVYLYNQWKITVVATNCHIWQLRKSMAKNIAVLLSSIVSNTGRTIHQQCSQTPPPHGEKGLAHFERYLVFADSTVQEPGLPIRLQVCDLSRASGQLCDRSLGTITACDQDKPSTLHRNRTKHQKHRRPTCWRLWSLKQCLHSCISIRYLTVSTFFLVFYMIIFDHLSHDMPAQQNTRNCSKCVRPFSPWGGGGWGLGTRLWRGTNPMCIKYADVT